MSLHEYLTSRAIAQEEPPFYALVMHLMRVADTGNLAKLQRAWPEVWHEMELRYNAPGGVLPADNVDLDVLSRQTVDFGGKVHEREKE